MTFTKRERWLGDILAWSVASILAIAILGFATGCGPDGQSFTLNDAEKFLKSANAEGTMSLRVTGSPLSYNMTHSLGPTVTIEFDGAIDFSKPDPE